MQPESLVSKPYSLEKLGQKAKDAGLELAEDGAGTLYKVVKEWFSESADESKNLIDDTVKAFIPQLDKIVLPQIDKIDHHEG